jgi:hypothetical protein
MSTSNNMVIMVVKTREWLLVLAETTTIRIVMGYNREKKHLPAA